MFDAAKEKVIEAVVKDMIQDRYGNINPSELALTEENKIRREAKALVSAQMRKLEAWEKSVAGWTQEEAEKILEEEQIKERGQ